MSLSSRLPRTSLFEVRDTHDCGRGVFALQGIPAGTPLLQTASLPASVVLRDYKREVCAQCFAYERGRNLKIRCTETGHSFCSTGCMDSWTEEAGPIAIQAWIAVEGFIKSKSMQGNGSGNGSGNDDHELQHINQVRPNEEEIQKAWNSVSSTAHFILEARNGSTRKPHRRALTSVLAIPPNPDYLSFLLSATLSRFKAATSSTEPATATATEWDALLQLVPDPTPYATSSCLQIALQSYLHLLALLPTALLPSVSASAFLALAQRDSHNSFGIRSLDDGGDEFLGYGVWPAASFFNHSCSPNVGKKRVGREWEFWTSRRVEVGEELCISYLGGDEVGLGVAERRERLFETWAFECECVRCGMEGLKVLEGAEVEVELESGWKKKDLDV